MTITQPLLRSLLPILFALVWLAPFPASSQPALNPVANASFEAVEETTGLPSGWSAWAKPSLACYTLATAHSGVAAALVTDTDATVSQGLRCTPVPVKPGQTYEGSCWVKIAQLQAGGFALYLEYWCEGQRVKDVAVSTAEVGEWQRLSLSAPAPANADHATVLIYAASATIGVAYFDDAAIMPVARP